jgi:two-component system chemotaxis response regulator CheB
VLHRKHEYDGALESLIQTHTALRVKAVEDKEKVDTGTIYVAPADYHLLMDDSEIFSLDRSEKVHFSRPSIDVTMESVTDVYGGNMIAVLLSGANCDGTAGLKKVKQAGGITIVQDPESAAVREMPESAIKTGSAVWVQTTENMITSINKLISDGTV